VSRVSVQERAGAVRFAVRVQPRASTDEIAGVHGDALRVRLRAPPVDGAANAALIELLAACLGVAKQRVRVVTGASSRAKVVEVEGVTRTHVERLTSNE
jgi:uncharacterized protein